MTFYFQCRSLSENPSGFHPNVDFHMMSKLVVAYEALPDFDALRIPYFLPPLHLVYWYRRERGGNHIHHVEQREHPLMERARGTGQFTIECFKKSKMGCHEAEGRKKITVRVIRLSSALSRPDYYPGPVEVE